MCWTWTKYPLSVTHIPRGEASWDMSDGEGVFPILKHGQRVTDNIIVIIIWSYVTRVVHVVYAFK